MSYKARGFIYTIIFLIKSTHPNTWLTCVPQFHSKPGWLKQYLLKEPYSNNVVFYMKYDGFCALINAQPQENTPNIQVACTITF